MRVLVKPKERLADKFERIRSNLGFELFRSGLYPVVPEEEREFVLLFESAELRDEFKHQDGDELNLGKCATVCAKIKCK